MLAICLAMLDQEADRRLFLETYEENKRRVYHVAYGVLQDQHQPDAGTDEHQHNRRHRGAG